MKVKRPKENYILNGVLGYDYAVLWLAFVLTSPAIFATSIALGFYLLAFFAVYEIGYFDNDRVGLAKEKKPVVSEAFHDLGQYFRPAWAWTFGIILAGIGSAVETLSQPSTITYIEELSGMRLFMWNWLLALTLLAVTRLTFLWFNATVPELRFAPMLVLQLERTLGYVLILGIGTIGAVLCVSHAFGRWIPYVIYRFGGKRERFPSHIATLFIFLACLPIVTIADQRPATSVLTFELCVISIYLLLRAAKDLMKFRYRTDVQA